MRRNLQSLIPRLVALATLLAIVLAAGVAALSSGTAGSAVPRGAAIPGDEAVQLRQPADPYIGKVTPKADADRLGMFGPQMPWTLIPVHAVLQPNGHVLTYGSPANTVAQGGLDYDDFNPAVGASLAAHVTTRARTEYNSFCNFGVLGADGLIYMAGGNTVAGAATLDPDTARESALPSMRYPRWYGSVLRRPDGSLLVVGGGDYYVTDGYRTRNDARVSTTPEIFRDGAWVELTGARSSDAAGAVDNRYWYPRIYNAPDGRVFGLSWDQMWYMLTPGSGAFTHAGVTPFPAGASSSTVMLAPGRILVSGGGERANDEPAAARRAASIIDINAPSPRVSAVTPMNSVRNWHNLTVLPDGRVLANGGTIYGVSAGGGAGNSQYQAEMYDPVADRWSNLDSAQRIRSYHSISLLMPSGGVLTGGGGVPGPEDNLNAEMFYPPSMFARVDGKVQWADRPLIRSLAGQIRFGSTLTLGLSTTRTIAQASLISTGAVTHSFNTDQRRIPLTFEQNGAEVKVALPSDENRMPAGTYLLSVVDSDGVSSPAQTITIKRDGSPGAVTIYEVDREPAPDAGGGGSTEPGVVPLTVGTSIGFEPVGLPGKRIRHTDGRATLAELNEASPEEARRASSFVVRPGLAGTDCLSFEAVDRPGSYLRHRGSEVWVDPRADETSYAGAATWCPERGKLGQYTSLRSYDASSSYLTLPSPSSLAVRAVSGSTDDRANATFAVREGLAPAPGRAELEAVLAEQTDTEVTVRVHNAGEATGRITAVQIGGAGWSQSAGPSAPFEVAGGATAVLTFSRGSVDTELALTTDAGAVLRVALTQAPAPPPPAVAQLGLELLSQSDDETVVKVVNTGGADGRVTSVGVPGGGWSVRGPSVPFVVETGRGVELRLGRGSADGDLVVSTDTGDVLRLALTGIEKPEPEPELEPEPSVVPDPSAGGWRSNGAASVVSGALQLTPATADTRGSAFFPDPVAVGDGLTVSFDATVGDGTGADGLALVLADPARGAASTSLGGGGGSLGFGGIAGHAVALVSYPNGTQAQGDFLGISDGAKAGAWQTLNWLSAQSLLAPLQNTTRRVTVSITRSTITARMDGVTVVETVAVPGTVLLGFTAATGGLTNRHTIRNVTVTST